MKFKRILSIFATVAMIAQSIIAMPLANAQETGEVAKLGLVYSNDGTADGNVWMAPTGGSVETYVNFKTDSEDEDLTYAELTSNATTSQNTLAGCSYMYAPLGEDKIKFEEDKTIVVDIKLRAEDIDTQSINKRVQIKYNLSENHERFNIKYQGEKEGVKTPALYEPGGNHLALADINYFGMRFSDAATSGLVGGVSTDKYEQNHWISTAYKDEQGNQNNKWYRYVMKIDYGMNVTYEVYKDGETTPVYKQKGQPHWITTSEYLENIAIMNLFGQSGKVDVDYLNIYNVPKSDADNFESYDNTFEEIKISNVKVDGVPIDDVTEVTKGTVTFDSTKAVTIKEVYYKAGNDKVTLSDSDYTFENNTVTFKNKLVASVEYTVVLDKGYALYPIVFNSAYVARLGLVYSNDGTNGFYAPTDLTNKATVTYNDGYVTMSSSGKWVDADAKTAPYIFASLGEDKIKFEDNKTVVIETRVKLNDFITSLNALKIGYNLPKTNISSFKVKNKSTGADVTYLSNNTTHMVEFRAGSATNTYMRFGKDEYLKGDVKFANPSDIDNQWFKVIIKIKPGFIFDYDVYDESGSHLVNHDNFEYQFITKSEYFENLAFVMTHNTFDGKVDVDYIKVYNMLVNDAENYEESKWQTSLTENHISDIKIDGVALAEVEEATKGTVTFESSADVNVKEVYYEKDGVKTPVSEYTFKNNTVTFNNVLESNVRYTVLLDLGYTTYPISFDSEYIQPVGLIYENDGTSGWEVGYDFIDNQNQKAEISYVDGYMHFVPSGNASNVSYLSTPMVFASLGENKIKFRKDYTIVAEMMVRTNAAVDAESGRTRISYSFPEDSSLSKFTYVNDQSIAQTGQKQTTYQSNLCSEALFEFEGGGVRFGVGTYPTGSVKVAKERWYKLIAKIDGNYKASYTVIDPETGAVVTEFGGQRQIWSKSGFFENIAVSTWMQSGSLPNAYTDVDYIKVYNMPFDYADEYEVYDGIVSEEDIKGAETNGVITLDFDETVTDEVIKDIEISNRNNKEITFGTSLSNGGKTLTIRVNDPLDGDRYEVTVNGETKRYNVVNPYFAELTLKGFTTDIPEVYSGEGAKLYKAQYDEGGRLTAVEVKDITGEVTTATLSDDSAKVFLWDENNEPLENYKDTYTIGFLGGSLTEQGAVWRSKVQSILAENMPEKEIIAYAAGKGGTNSNYGANRFEVDLGQYDIDLLFIDFAVNDREMTTKDQHTQYMENIIQQCLAKENVPEIVFIYTPMQYGVDHDQYKMWKQGVEWKEELAAHYGIKTINIYDYMYAEWEAEYKSTYPTYEEYILAELGYKETSPGVIDVHAGFAKYAEAIAKAYADDYEGCFTTPKNTVLFGSNVKNIFAKYNHVTLASDRIVHDGWTMTNYENPGLSGKYHFAYPYFVDGMLQSTSAGATVEITTDADQLGFSFPSSTKGGSVTYYVDGATEGKTINCSSIYDNVISQKWITLPGDGNMHTVKIVTNEVTDTNYFVRIAEFIEYYEGTK